MISGRQLAEAGYKYLGTPYSQMDCQAFVEQCLLDAGLDWNLAGSNSWYRTMDWTGTPEECVQCEESATGRFLKPVLEKNRE